MTTEHIRPQELCLFVLKTYDIEGTKTFYETLGFSYSKHRHGKGPIHYSSEDMGFPFELYPSSVPHKNSVCLGFRVNGIERYRSHLMEQGILCSEITKTEFGTFFSLRDPEDNRIEVYDAKR